MARENNREKRKPLGTDKRRPMKKKVSILISEGVDWIDYKDVNLLRRFVSERAKIRARRVTGNNTQQQRAVAKAIRLSREMGLLPYTVRQVTQRSKGGGGGRRDREGGGRDGGRDRELSADAVIPETTIHELPEGITMEGEETMEIVVERNPEALDYDPTDDTTSEEA